MNTGRKLFKNHVLYRKAQVFLTYKSFYPFLVPTGQMFFLRPGFRCSIRSFPGNQTGLCYSHLRQREKIATKMNPCKPPRLNVPFGPGRYLPPYFLKVLLAVVFFSVISRVVFQNCIMIIVLPFSPNRQDLPSRSFPGHPRFLQNPDRPPVFSCYSCFYPM